MGNSWGKQQANQKVCKEKLGNEVSMEIFKVTTYSWDLRRPHAGYVLAQERPKDTLRSCLWLTLRSGSRGPGQSCQPPGWALRDHLSHTEARLAKTGDLWFPALKENYPIISWMLSSVRRDFSGHKWQRTDFIEFALHKEKQSKIANSSTSQPWGKGGSLISRVSTFCDFKCSLEKPYMN